MKSFAVTPRKPSVVSDADARKLEEAIAAKGEAVAGLPQPAPSAPAPARERPAEAAPEPNPSPAPEMSSDAAKRPAPRKAPRSRATGVGTLHNPRVRKTDGVKTRVTSFHLPIDLAEELAVFCARSGHRQSEVVTEAIDTWLRRKT
jgi:hypothetical protein